MAKEIFVIESFKKDLDNFIDEFVNLGEKFCNFDKFSLIWKSKKFYLIFQGILHVNQLHEFMDETFELCLKKFQLNDNYLSKVCLIFMIYSLYFKQPDEDIKFRIRLQQSNLESIRLFIDECKVKLNNEVIFCWYKLLAVGAIDFVYQINYYGPWFIRRQNYDKESIKMKTVDDNFIKHLKELDNFQIDYDKLKLNIDDCENKEEIQELDLIEESKNLFTDYLKEFENLRKKFDKS